VQRGGTVTRSVNPIIPVDVWAPGRTAGAKITGATAPGTLIDWATDFDDTDGNTVDLSGKNLRWIRFERGSGSSTITIGGIGADLHVSNNRPLVLTGVSTALAISLVGASAVDVWVGYD
jgi:hypothetical protein